MEHAPTNESQPTPKETGHERNPDVRVERTLRNRLVLGVALMAGMFAAQGASAQEVAARYGSSYAGARTTVTEQAHHDAQEQRIQAAGAVMARLESQLEKVREQYHLRKVTVGYTSKSIVRLPSGAAMEMGMTMQFDRYEPDAGTPDSVRHLIEQHDASIQEYVNIRM